MANNIQRRWSWRLDRPNTRERCRRSGQGGGGGGGGVEYYWKCTVMFGFALTTVLSLLDIKYQNRGGELFENHPVVITISLLSMLVAVSASAAVKFLNGLLPPWVRLVLFCAAPFCAFQSLVLLISVVLYDKIGRAGFVLCVCPIFLLPNPFKWLKGLGWFRCGGAKLLLEEFHNYLFGAQETDHDQLPQ